MAPFLFTRVGQRPMTGFDNEDFFSQRSMRKIFQVLNKFFRRPVKGRGKRPNQGPQLQGSTFSLVIDFIRDPRKLAGGSLDTQIAAVQKWEQDLIERTRHLGQLLIEEEKMVEGWEQFQVETDVWPVGNES